MMPATDALTPYPLFAGMEARAARSRLVAALRAARHSAGAVLVAEGAEASELIVAIPGRCPLDGVGAERTRNRDRSSDLPPPREIVGVEERVQHARRRRLDDDRLLEMET